jgi:hypothetical protein
MFVDVMSQESKQEEKKLKKSKTYVSGRSVVQPTLATKGKILQALCLPGNVPTGRIVDFSARTSTICIQHEVSSAAC